MRCYLIRDTRVAVLHTCPTKPPANAILIESAKSLDVRRFPTPRLVAIFNTLPGISPVKRFTDRAAAVKRLWAALETLPITSSKTESKQARLLALLQRPEGASMAQLITATGWQPHSIRGTLSGVLRKKLGLTIVAMNDGEKRTYKATGCE